MKPDIIVTWPSGLDYPLWRWQIKQYRKLFNEVIVVFYPHGRLDFTRFLSDNFRGVTFLLSDSSSTTWREDAVNTALNRSKSDWVWFTEQDFIIKDKYYFDRIFAKMSSCDTIVLPQGIRYHPASLFCKRETIEKTTRNFGTGPKNFDHFSYFSEELRKVAKIVTHKDLDLIERRDFYHMSSLTWNYFRCWDEDLKDIHEAANFLVWNYYSRTRKVPQSKEWLAFSYWCEQRLSSFGKFLT